HPDRDAGAAVLAGRSIGDRLAAAETAMGQEIIELGGALADEMREHLALLLARQIGARRGRGEIELRCVAGMVGRGRPQPAPFGLPTSLRSRARRVSSNPCCHRGARRNASARGRLLMTIVPTSMSCSSRRRSLKKATRRISGVRNEIVNQYAMACTAPSRK